MCIFLHILTYTSSSHFWHGTSCLSDFTTYSSPIGGNNGASSCLPTSSGECAPTSHSYTNISLTDCPNHPCAFFDNTSFYTLRRGETPAEWTISRRGSKPLWEINLLPGDTSIWKSVIRFGTTYICNPTSCWGETSSQRPIPCWGTICIVGGKPPVGGSYFVGGPYPTGGKPPTRIRV
jgi:hypothetical protein